MMGGGRHLPRWVWQHPCHALSISWRRTVSGRQGMAVRQWS